MRQHISLYCIETAFSGVHLSGFQTIIDQVEFCIASFFEGNEPVNIRLSSWIRIKYRYYIHNFVRIVCHDLVYSGENNSAIKVNGDILRCHVPFACHVSLRSETDDTTFEF